MLHLKPQIFHLHLSHRRATPSRLKTSGACFTPNPPQRHPRARGCIFGRNPPKNSAAERRKPPRAACAGAPSAAPTRAGGPGLEPSPSGGRAPGEAPLPGPRVRVPRGAPAPGPAPGVRPPLFPGGGGWGSRSGAVPAHMCGRPAHAH